MLNSIYCEFLKLKKSHFYLSIILIACIMPLTLFLGWLVQGHYVIWNRYLFQMEQLAFMFLTITLSSLIAAYIFAREFSQKTMSTLFCYPVNKTKIFFSKLITMAIFTAIAIIFELLLSISLGFFLNHEPFTSKILFNHLIVALYNILALYAISPIAILITLLCKNIVVPLIYSFAISIINVLVLTLINSKNLGSIGNFLKDNCPYIPTYHPLLSFTNCFSQSKGNEVIVSVNSPLTGASIAVDLIVFIAVTSLCIFYYSKCEVK